MAKNLAFKFGDFDGRKNVKLTLPGNNGATSITFGMTGGGFGQIQSGETGRDVIVNPTGTGAAVSITSVGGNHPSVRNVNVNGALKTFVAPTTDFLGDFSATGTIGTLTLGDVSGGHDLAIGAGTSKSTTVIKLGHVEDTNLTSATPIKSLTALDWRDFDAGANPDLITAPTSDKLTTTTGNFEPTLTLANPANKTQAIGKATIRGILHGRWTVMGGAGTITAGTIHSFFHASFDGPVTGVTSRTGFSGGFFAAPSFKTIAYKDIADLLIVYAGAQLGTDGEFGGTGDAADQFGAGRIDKLTVTNNAGMLINIGLDPVNGVVGDAGDVIKPGGVLKSMSVGGQFNSGLVVGAQLPKTVTTANDSRFRTTPDIFENVPPAVDVILANDNGDSTTDGITSDPTINVLITHGNVLASFFVSIDGAPAIDIGISLPGNEFSLDATQLADLNGGAFIPGNHTLRFRAVDALGNSSALSTFTFTLVGAEPLMADAIITSEAIDETTYHYAVTLNNAGTTTIGTFWFAWIPGPNYMPTVPMNIVSPAGWTASITHNGPGDGYGILWMASATLMPAGGPSLTFEFDSATTPAEMAGIAVGHPGVPVLRSFVYIAGPTLDGGFQFDVTPQFV